MTSRTISAACGLLLLLATGAVGAQEPPDEPSEVREEAETSEGEDDEVAGEPEADEKAETPEEATAEQPKPLQTQPADLGFGENRLVEDQHFPDPAQFQARVDRRGGIDASSDRAILWPTAYTPDQGSFVFSNYFFFGNQISASATDHTQISATGFIPAVNVDLSVGLSVKQTLLDNHQIVVSVQPFLNYRTGNQEFDTRDLGGGVGFLADVYANDELVFGFFLYGYGTMWWGWNEFDYSGCESRSEYIDGTCTEIVSHGESFPRGGHWLSGGVSSTFYFLDDVSLRLELFSGAVAGSFLGSEYIYGQQTYEENRSRFEDGELAYGIPYDGNVTGGAGFGWSNGMLAVQLAGYAYFGVHPTLQTRQILLTPMFTASAKF